MDAILLFSHGSILCGAERNLIEVASAMRERGDAPIVEVGFLNYSEPLFRESVERCIEQGATRIIVAPWFLIAGKFVVDDLPATIAEAREAHPDVEFSVAGVIGFHPLLADAVISAAGSAKDPEEWRSNPQAYSWCRESPRCPLYRTEGCRAPQEALA